MALPDSVKNSDHTSILITCQREDGSVVDLTGSTLTGVFKNKVTLVNKNITGTLSLVDAIGGQFRWLHSSGSAGDVANAGNFKVQFTATYGDSTKEISIPEDWQVVDLL